MSAPDGPGRSSHDAPGHGEWWGTEVATVRYGERRALDSVSFRAEPGRVSAVVGGDGAGRTTLLRCLAGALAPSGGVVRRPAPERIGYLPAGGGVYPDLSVRENLGFRAAAYRMPPARARARGAELLERTGLAGARDRLAGRLSGGMRRKLGVIAALLPGPDLLVLDEPTTGVDPVSRVDLWALIARAAAGGAAVVVATSYLDEAERAFDVLVLDAGRELARGAPGQIVAAMPGSLWVSGERPPGELARRSWRREGRWRVWDPGGVPGDAAGGGAPWTGGAARGRPGQGARVEPDLQDAVTVAALRREMAGSGGEGRPGGAAAGAGGSDPGSGGDGR